MELPFRVACPLPKLGWSWLVLARIIVGAAHPKRGHNHWFSILEVWIRTLAYQR